ncbi:hypothetical protein [Shewanella gaetbuli]|uniref:FlgO domain-containing protein n=1 Tax=Shewanella gaetbuli TaxID=220752 RepID=A0A9X2CGW2_9GAMM|nr:hypothetical protein [Shewanella gaetbuli]MCL1142833.1 hypothetical protein [Shewanella gaetbuli]
MSFFSELKRRNVFKVASVYLVTSWIILQVVAVISPALHLPTLFSTIFTVVLVMGFPVACIFAWAFELTPDGLKYSHEVDETESIRHHTGTKINYFLAIALLFALSFISYEKWFVASANDNLERSIAVLPFEDMSSDKSQGYFGDGISEEILNSLARLNQLVVIARTSSFSFKGSKTDIREIGRILDVNYVLEGSVRKDKDQLRITAQLIEVESGKHIWSQTYDRTLDGIFTVQDELTYAITQALKLNLLPEQVNHEAGMTTNSEAYELFLEGRELSYQRTPESIQQAAELLQQAITLDDQFYLAKAQLYMVYALANSRGGFSLDEQQAERERLFWELLIAPNFPFKFMVMASHAELNNKSNAKKLYLKAYQGAPNEPLIQNLYLLSVENTQQVIKEREKILKTNPKSEINYVNLITLYTSQGSFQASENLITLYIKTFPEHASTGLYYQLDILYGLQHDLPTSAAYANSFNHKSSPPDYSFLIKAELNLLYGDIDKALDSLENGLVHSPEIAKYSYNFLLLMERFKNQQALNKQQLSKLQQLPLSDEIRTSTVAYQGLLLGKPEKYQQLNDLADVDAHEFKQKVKQALIELDIDPFLYAAIKKQQGDKSYAVALNSHIKSYLKNCHYPRVDQQLCLLFMYLDGGFSTEQQYAVFESSLSTLNLSYVAIEVFIFTSPIYYGVNQHPEFEKAANDLLDRTFRKWQHHIASNEALFKRDFKN